MAANSSSSQVSQIFLFHPLPWALPLLLPQAGIGCTILSGISIVLDPWVASAPGTLPSPPALSPKTHQHQPNITPVTAGQGREQSPACAAASPPPQEQKGRAEKSWNVCWVTTGTGMARTGQGKCDKDAGGEDSISWGEGYFVGSKI